MEGTWALRDSNATSSPHTGSQFDIGASLGVSRDLMSTRFSRTVLVLVLVALILTLTPLAYADPPDPTWITGLWDDDDFDDVVGYITSAAGLFHTPSTAA